MGGPTCPPLSHSLLPPSGNAERWQELLAVDFPQDRGVFDVIWAKACCRSSGAAAAVFLPWALSTLCVARVLDDQSTGFAVHVAAKLGATLAADLAILSAGAAVVET